MTKEMEKVIFSHRNVLFNEVTSKFINSILWSHLYETRACMLYMPDIYATHSFHMHHDSINNPVQQMYSRCSLLMINCSHSSILACHRLHAKPSVFTCITPPGLILVYFYIYANCASKQQTFSSTAEPAATPF